MKKLPKSAWHFLATFCGEKGFTVFYRCYVENIRKVMRIKMPGLAPLYAFDLKDKYLNNYTELNSWYIFNV